MKTRWWWFFFCPESETAAARSARIYPIFYWKLKILEIDYDFGDEMFEFWGMWTRNLRFGKKNVWTWAKPSASENRLGSKNVKKCNFNKLAKTTANLKDFVVPKTLIFPIYFGQFRFLKILNFGTAPRGAGGLRRRRVRRFPKKTKIWKVLTKSVEKWRNKFEIDEFIVKMFEKIKNHSSSMVSSSSPKPTSPSLSS